MKKIFGLCCLLMLTLANDSCQQRTTSPTAVAIEFSKAWMQKDFAKLKTLVSLNDQAMLDEGATMYNQQPDSLKALLNQMHFKATNEKIENDTVAYVDITTTSSEMAGDANATTETYVLKKENGRWKIDMAGTIKKAMEHLSESLRPIEGSAATDTTNQN